MKTADAHNKDLTGRVEPGPGVAEVEAFYASLVPSEAIRKARAAERERIRRGIETRIDAYNQAIARLSDSPVARTIAEEQRIELFYVLSIINKDQP